MTNTISLWTGGYSGERGADGIGLLRVDEAGRAEYAGVAAAAESPSFVAVHPLLPMAYAVEEHGPRVRGFRVTGDDGELAAAGAGWPTGEASCHVAVAPTGEYLVVSCWGDGEVAAYPLDADGTIQDRLPVAPAVDPHGGTGRVSRAHAALFLPDGRVMTTDLGFDLARVWRYEPGTGLVADHEVTLPSGSGPRHLAMLPTGAVAIVTEFSIEVLVLAQDASGAYVLDAVLPATAGGARPGDSAAEISYDAATGVLHVTVRGSDRVSTLPVAADGTVGSAVADVPCGGETPRHHLVVGPWLHVANQASGTVTTFAIDRATGVPAAVASTPVPTPSCLVRVRAAR